jgi:hypothetical protein
MIRLAQETVRAFEARMPGSKLRLQNVRPGSSRFDITSKKWQDASQR